MNARKSLAGLCDKVFRSEQSEQSNIHAGARPFRPETVPSERSEQTEAVGRVPGSCSGRSDHPFSRSERWIASDHVGCSDCSDRSDPMPSGAAPAGGFARLPTAPMLDDAGDPCRPCPSCGGRLFHRVPGHRWRCSHCEPPNLPPAHRAAGWALCGLLPEPETRR